jgi:carbon-monoxide dehydrogenase large subunit
MADRDGFPQRRAESAARGLLRGIGIGNYLECTGVPAKEMGGIRFDADGGVTLITGTMDYGQGHRTPFAQLLQDRLNIPMERVRLLPGDSDALIAGGGSGGSRSLMASGSAILEAADQVIEKGLVAAAQVLEAAAVDIEFAAGRFIVAGTDHAITLLRLAAELRTAPALPEGVPDSLDVSHIFAEAPMAYPNGCHVAEVEIDPETGIVTLLRYVAVNDFGVLVNPLMVEGQVHGGVAQGVGQVLMERVAYAQDGQLLTGSYMDYAMPRASDMPPIDFHSLPSPATTNRLGVKGCGEAGCAGSLPAATNAILDALRPLGVTHIDMPARPETVWAAIQVARSRPPLGEARQSLAISAPTASICETSALPACAIGLVTRVIRAISRFSLASLIGSAARAPPERAAVPM